jgi:hypothetical protein
MQLERLWPLPTTQPFAKWTNGFTRLLAARRKSHERDFWIRRVSWNDAMLVTPCGRRAWRSGRGAYVTIPAWDFDFAPIAIGGGDDGEPDTDFVVATREDVDTARVAALVRSLASRIEVTSLLTVHPLYWTRVVASERIDALELAERLSQGGLPVRYVASARRGSQRLAPPLDFASARPRRAKDWAARREMPVSDAPTLWRWFLGERGANIDRSVCGTGAGTRLALIDNDGRDLEHIELDAEVLVGVESVPRAASHAALLLGWAIGANTPNGRFHGAAPGASPRFYCIPKPRDDVYSLPQAIARAVDDGADVVVCATSVEGQTSPLLDDALEFAVQLGRGGRGAAVVFPTGREMSSPRDTLHSALSLPLGDPASDPRVCCVGPSGRDGRWFLWRDKKRKLRPFANRGPALRFLAPGDDLAYPFSDEDRPAHAESSGAAAIAAGVTLLVLARNPELTLPELDRAIRDTLTTVDAGSQCDEPDLADADDLLPRGSDPDGHNAKHGYGRMNATQACLCVGDPVAAVLTRIGESSAAARYLVRARERSPANVYSDKLAAWAARALLREEALALKLSVLARAIRLFCVRPGRLREQHPGHLLRHIALCLRTLLAAHPPAEFLAELEQLEKRTRKALATSALALAAEQEIVEYCSALWTHQACDAGEDTHSSKPDLLAHAD